MYSIITGSLIISLLHAVIPNHWLPVLAIGKKDNWTLQEVTKVTFIYGLAHALSTIVIRIILELLGLPSNGFLFYWGMVPGFSG